jgi:hypothetical protein
VQGRGARRTGILIVRRQPNNRAGPWFILLGREELLEAIVKVLEGDGDRLPEKDQGKPDVTRVPNPFA